jgi:hypothetical protein
MAPFRSKSRISPPPAKARMVKVPYNRSAKLQDILPRYFRAEAWEMELLRAIQPKRYARIFPDLNNNGEHSRAYLRFAEQMPDGSDARHPLARYLHYMRAYVLFRLGATTEPDPRGPPIGPFNRDPLDVRASNRRELISSADAGGTVRNRRRGHAAGWSVRIRVDALLRGDDPEEAFQAECAKFRLKEAERAANNQKRPPTNKPGDDKGGQ